MSVRSLRAALSFLTILPVANADGNPGERLGRVFIEHRYRFLQDDGPVVVLLVNEVYGRAGDLRARGDHCLMHAVTVEAGAREGWLRPPASLRTAPANPPDQRGDGQLDDQQQQEDEEQRKKLPE